MNHRYILLIVLEAGKSKIEVPADLVSSETCCLDGHLLIIISRGGMEDRALWNLIYKGT